MQSTIQIEIGALPDKATAVCGAHEYIAAAQIVVRLGCVDRNASDQVFNNLPIPPNVVHAEMSDASRYIFLA